MITKLKPDVMPVLNQLAKRSRELHTQALQRTNEVEFLDLQTLRAICKVFIWETN